MLKVSEVEEYRNIVSVVDECPDKGITTYVDILKGSKNAKIRENSYDKLTAYSSLKSMKKSEIEECIEELMRGGVINTKYLKASFGRYWGLYVAGKYDSFISATTAILPENKMTQAYIKSLETTNIQDRIGAKKVVRTVKVSKVDTLDELIEELIDETSVLKSKALIKSARDNIKSFDKSKLNDLLEFIKDNRNAYKEVEEEFIKFLISIIDISLLPIFILQENMVNGVTKEFLSKLVIGLKEKSPNQTLA
jgi:superfamily II DNA helicase RecQ